MRGAEAGEHVRYLAERLTRGNRTARVEPELVDFLLDALRSLLAGRDPHRVQLTAAALDAIERQNTLTRAVLDDHIRRAIEVYLSLPTPAPGKRAARPCSRVGAVQGHGKGSPDAATGRQERKSGGES
jgi:hypothetical protein